MICSAAVRTLATARENAGWATVLPVTRGIRARIVSVLAQHDGRIGADGAQQSGRGRALGDQQRAEQVRRFDRRVARRGGGGNGRGDDLAALGGQVVEIHGWCGALSVRCMSCADCNVSTTAAEASEQLASQVRTQIGGTRAYARLHMVQRTKVESIPLNSACWVD